MMNFSLKRLLEKRLSGLQPKLARRVGRLGNSAGVVSVPGVPNAVYVRLEDQEQPVIVWNYRVAAQVNLPVTVGEDDINPGITQVLDARIYPGVTYPAGLNIGPHSDTHTWGGSDPTFIHTKQIIPLTLTPAGSLSVRLYPGDVSIAGVVVNVNYQTIDLTAHVPAAGACWATISVDTDGLAQVDVSADVAGIADLVRADIPVNNAPDEIRLWAVRLYTGQTAISNSFSNSDLVDLRFYVGAQGLAIEEQDGSPSVNPAVTLKLPNGTLTASGGGVATMNIPFTTLTDTPSSYAGYAGAPVVVKASVDGLEFADIGSGTGAQIYAPMVLLDSTAPAGGAASFASVVGSGYSYIEIVISGKSEYTGADEDYVRIALNSDTTAGNYRWSRHYAYPSFVGSQAGDDRYVGMLAASKTADMSGGFTLAIPNPCGAIDRKIMYSSGSFRYTASEIYTSQFAVQWESAAAISEISLALASGSDFAEGTRCIVTGWRKVYVTPQSVDVPVIKTATYDIVAGDPTIVCNKGTAMTINLPAATGSGAKYTIASIGAGAVTIDGASSETINGATTQLLYRYESMTVQDYTAGGWIIV